MWEIKNAMVLCDDTIVLEEAVAVTGLHEDSYGGAYMRLRAKTAAEETVYDLGFIPQLCCFMGGYRSIPFFMSHECGKEIAEIHEETLFLLTELENGQYVLFLPLFDEYSRAALGSQSGRMTLVGVTGSPELSVDSGELLYVISGRDPYVMMESAALSLRKHMGTFRLRTEKVLPLYFQYLGWCTWDAFYFDVDAVKLLDGLREFRRNGISIGSVIMDDGWLTTTEEKPIGSRRLAGFHEKTEKFPHGLAEMIREIKEKDAVSCVMVWHASMGYWGGVDIEGFRGKDSYARFPQAVNSYADALNKQFAHHPLLADKAESFYEEWYDYLHSAGVDGVKIDVQYLIEALSAQAGGRTRAMRIYHQAIESAVHKYFHDNCLNCMSCSNDMVYRMTDSNAIRSGNDFMPKIRNYGAIVSNAYSNYWLAPFACADWDMFWSSKTEARVEAIARVVGGSAVYISDRPGEHDYALLKSLCTEDGRVLRPLDSGRPTLDCLMSDPLHDGTVLKLFNRNTSAYLIGAFNFSSSEVKSCVLSPKDALDTSGERFVLTKSGAEQLAVISSEDTTVVELNPESAELFAFSPIRDGLAVIGLVGKLNATAAVDRYYLDKGTLYADVIDYGCYLFYSEACPEAVIINGKKIPFSYAESVLSVEYR